MNDSGPFPADPRIAFPSSWKVRGSLSRRAYLSIALGSFAALALGWLIAAGSDWVDPVFLPSPGKVLVRLLRWWGEDELARDVRISVFRVSAGFLSAAVMAIPLGIFMGSYRPVQALFEPLLEFARYLPAVAFVPLILLWVGIGEGAKITMIWIGTFFQMVLMIADEIRRVPQALIDAAETLGATQGEVLRQVLFRAALPGIVDTLRVTLGWAWTYLVVAELVASNSGIGYVILKAQRFLQTDKIFVGIFLIGALGLGMDQSLRLLHRQAFPWLYAKRQP
jgi:NitT/TauT family transport system permease protein